MFQSHPGIDLNITDMKIRLFWGDAGHGEGLLRISFTTDIRILVNAGVYRGN